MIDKQLRILLLEDNPADAELIEYSLRRAGLEFSSMRVESKADFAAALGGFKPAIILSDYQLPRFNGLQALEMVRSQGLHLPFIFVTGAMGENLAVESLRLGATDYILKDRLPRLPEAVRRALDDTQRQTAILLAATVFDVSDQGIVITDANRCIELVNPVFTKTTGYSAAEVMGKNPRIFKSGLQSPVFYQEMWAQLEAHDHWQGEITNRRKDRTLYPEWLSIAAVRDPSGAITNYVGIFTDLTASKALDERLAKLSHFDPLTGLPNRTLFLDRMEQSIKSAQRAGEGLALFALNLSRFHVFNDTFGYQAGDVALKAIATRLQRLVREGDSIARLFGDEIMICIGDLKQSTDAISLAQKVIDCVAEPVTINGDQICLSSCLGISIFPQDGVDALSLMRAADIALKRAKLAGGNAFRFFSPDEDAFVARRMQLETDLSTALARQELELNYQPQIDLTTGRINGVEALLRWNHATLGRVPPSEFIPIAEDAGLIAAIGTWTLHEACRQNKEWVDSGLATLPVAVNLSAKQFNRADLLESVQSALVQSQLPPSLLELELTESAVVSNIDDAARVIAEIKKLGVLLAMDDFGTGYSSLAYISRFAFDKIKIDQSFVRDITQNPVNAAIATATIGMGRSLNMTVLAEGVETESQMQFLRRLECDSMQGFLFSRALSATDLTAMLATGVRLDVGTANQPLQTLLLVDDEVPVLNSLKRILRREGYDILTATSAAEALELLAKNTVQVIISDQLMLGMSGTEFLFRAKQLYPNTVRMILSGYSDLQTITDAINRGAIYRFLHKPWDDQQLRDEIQAAFRVANSRRVT